MRGQSINRDSIRLSHYDKYKERKDLREGGGVRRHLGALRMCFRWQSDTIENKEEGENARDGGHGL